MDEIFNGTASCFSSEVVGSSGKIVSAIVFESFFIAE